MSRAQSENPALPSSIAVSASAARVAASGSLPGMNFASQETLAKVFSAFAMVEEPVAAERAQRQTLTVSTASARRDLAQG